MNEVREEQLLEDKKMRDKLIGRIEVLEKVKKVLLLDKVEILTSQMVAEYYEVNDDVIRQLFVRNKEELMSNGAKTLEGSGLRDMKSLSGFKSRARSITVYSVRAVLNVGMLLRDSIIAREIRSQLLNGYENLSEEQKVKEIVSERDLLYAIIDTADDPIKQMMAVGELNNYHNRHKAELNVRIDKMKPNEAKRRGI